MFRRITSGMKLARALDDLLEKGLQWAWRHRKILAATLAVLVAAWALEMVQGEDPADPPETRAVLSLEAAGPERLVEQLCNRLWVDKAPRGHQDRFHMYFFLRPSATRSQPGPEGPRPIGVHITFHSATWRVQEFFTWEARDGKLALRFYDPKVKTVSPVKLKEFDGKDFDLALELRRDPQAKGTTGRYFRLKERAAAWLPTPGELAGMLAKLPEPR